MSGFPNLESIPELKCESLLITLEEEMVAVVRKNCLEYSSSIKIAYGKDVKWEECFLYFLNPEKHLFPEQNQLFAEFRPFKGIPHV